MSGVHMATLEAGGPNPAVIVRFLKNGGIIQFSCEILGPKD